MTESWRVSGDVLRSILREIDMELQAEQVPALLRLRASILSRLTADERKEIGEA